jgi:hypothetical protein
MRSYASRVDFRKCQNITLASMSPQRGRRVNLWLMNASHKIVGLQNTTLSNASYSAASHHIMLNRLSITLSSLVGMTRAVLATYFKDPGGVTQVIIRSTPQRRHHLVQMTHNGMYFFHAYTSERNRRSAVGRIAARIAFSIHRDIKREGSGNEERYRNGTDGPQSLCMRARVTV